MLQTFLTVIHIGACLLLIPVILIQSGKGADISASFGGSSQTIFGSSGGANFFTRLTTGLAVIFMLTSLGITTFTNQEKKKSIFEGTSKETTTTPSPTTAPSPVASPVTATPNKSTQ